MSNNKTEKKSDSVISYHTFIFPFLWKIGGNGKIVSMKKFLKCKHPGWFEDTFDAAKETREFYAQYRYFNSAARNAIYFDGGKNVVVRNYRFDMACLNGQATNKKSRKKELDREKSADNPALFIIKKSRDEGEGCTDIKNYEYTLKINGIRLKLFSSGIGMIVYELENYDCHSIDDINRINEFGRRLYMPYQSDYGCSLCADSITIVYPDPGSKEKDAKLTWDSEISSLANDSQANIIKLPAFITNLLTKGDYTVTTDAENESPKAFYIEPIIGDRMFVACFYKNNGFVTKLSEWKDDRYRYLYDAKNKSPYDEDNLATKLYEYIFVDGNGLSCYNRNMLYKLLDDHIYFRWAEIKYAGEPSGTVMGISEYSMVSMTGSDDPGVMIAFLTEYIEMAILALAQRASLLVFERLISDSALKRQDIAKIQRDYIIFQSQLLLQEVTPEQQGIEIYKELVESLFIERESEQIENQISALFALKNYRNDTMESFILFILAIFGVTDVVNCFADWTVLSDLGSSALLRIIPSVLFIAAGTIGYIWYRNKK